MIKPIISRRLKGLMVERGITIHELSQEINIPEKTLVMKINGEDEWLFHENMCVIKYLGFTRVRDVFPEIYNYILDDDKPSK